MRSARNTGGRGTFTGRRSVEPWSPNEDEVRATEVRRVPEKVQLSYAKRKSVAWPWYVYGKAFFRGMGAEFRRIDGKEEMLLQHVVYDVEDYVPCSICRSRNIGIKAIS